MAGTLLSLVVLAGLAIGAGALLSPLLQDLASGPEAVEGALPDETFRIATAPAPPPPGPAVQAAAPLPPPQVVAAPTAASLPQPAVAGAAPKVQKVAARQPKAAKRTAAAVIKPADAEDALERQRREYEQARASYDASERSEGRRWAQQNRIRIERHCRAAEQRNAAFVEGCLAFVRSGRTASLQKSSE